MDWDAISGIAEIGGAIAVVVTLVYLARQIRDSAEATRISAYHQATEQIWAAAVAIANDKELSAILAKTYAADIDDLDFPERVRLEFSLGSFYFGVESMLTLVERGHIDQELWNNMFENNYRLFGSPLGRKYLATRKGPVSRRLEQLIDQHRSVRPGSTV